MDADQSLQLDYEQTTQVIRDLADIRFKLLAFVPTIAGASVGLVGTDATAGELLAVGLLGLVATIGILFHELGNSQIINHLVAHARGLESKLGLGLLSTGERVNVTLFGLVSAGRSRGLGLVYGAALAGWTYLVVWGACRALDIGHARIVGGFVGAAVGVAVAIDVNRRNPAPD